MCMFSSECLLVLDRTSSSSSIVVNSISNKFGGRVRWKIRCTVVIALLEPHGAVGEAQVTG